MTLVEVSIAVIVLAIGAIAAIGAMTASSEVDEEMRERATALRAAVTRLEGVLGYDYNGDIQTLLNWVALPGNASFTVEGLTAPAPGGATPHGTVAVDATDPERILVTVTVAWSGRRGQRQLALPMTLTEVIP